MAKHALDRVGYSFTKYTLAEIFKEAWIATVKCRLLSMHFTMLEFGWSILMFAKAKLPLLLSTMQVKRLARDNAKVRDQQSKVYVGLQVLYSALSSTTKKKFKSRYEEGCDVKDDELHNVWSKLNELKLYGGKNDLKPTSKSKQCAAAASSQEVNEVFKQALVIPDQVPHKKTLRRSQKLPEHLPGNEAIAKM